MDTVRKRTNVYILKCPHCNQEFRVIPGGTGTHCYDYTCKEGTFYMDIYNDITQCLKCNQELNFLENLTEVEYGNIDRN